MKYFTMAEMTNSAVARILHIGNKPDAEAAENLKALVMNVLDPARERIGMPIRVNSGYRSQQLNKAVGGVSDSQHLLGEAADVRVGSQAMNKRLYEVLLELPFDQLIWEQGSDVGPAWIHVSYKRNGKNNH